METVFAVCYIALLTLEQGYSNRRLLSMQFFFFRVLLRQYNNGIYFDCQYGVPGVGAKIGGGKAFKKMPSYQMKS